MEPFEKIRNVDLNEGIKTIDLGIFVYEGDNNSLRVGSRIFKGNTPATVSGSVIGRVIRPDGGTVVYEGQLSDNIASILLTEAAFAYAGQLKITIRIISGEDKITVGSYTVDAKRTDTGTEIDPGSVVPDLEEIIALMDDMEDAKNAANTAATEATAAASGALVNFAGAFSADTAYPAGAYVTYTDGYLYLLQNGHQADVAWANTDKTKVTAGGQLGELKSALFNNVIRAEGAMKYFYGYGYFSSGSFVSNDNIITLRLDYKFPSFCGYTWAENDPQDGIADNYKFAVEDTEGTFTVLTLNNEYAKDGTNKKLFVFPFVNAKYLYISFAATAINNVNLQLNNIYGDDFSEFKKSATIIPFNLKLVLAYPWYLTNTGSVAKIAGGLTVIWSQVAKDDRIIDIKSYTGLSFKGTFVGSTTKVKITDSAYTIPEDGAVCLFDLSTDIQTAKIVNANRRKIYKADILDFDPYAEVSPYDGLYGVAFGTSLTYRAQTTNGYLQYLPQLSGITFDNQGIGSSYIYGNMLSAIKAYTGYSGKRVCLLEGFVNDWYYNKTLGTFTDTTEDSVCGCVRSAINYMLSQNTNLTIFLILDHYGRNYNSLDCSSTAKNSGNKTQYEYYEEVAKVAESMGIPVIKLYAESQISENTTQYLSDNIHPTALGAKQTANIIWGRMKSFYPNEVSS